MGIRLSRLSCVSSLPSTTFVCALAFVLYTGLPVFLPLFLCLPYRFLIGFEVLQMYLGKA
jgi:hypothetical protein